MNTIGDRIRTARIDRHLTQQQVADALNVTNKAVSKWETCEALPETAQLVPLCDVLGLTVDELLGDPDRQKPQEGVLPQKDWLNMTKWYALNKKMRPADWRKRLLSQLAPSLAAFAAAAAIFCALYFTEHPFAGVLVGFALFIVGLWFLVRALLLHFNGYLPFDIKWRKCIISHAMRVTIFCALLIYAPIQIFIWLLDEPWLGDWTILPFLWSFIFLFVFLFFAAIVLTVDLICWLGDKMKYREAYANGKFDALTNVTQ